MQRFFFSTDTASKPKPPAGNSRVRFCSPLPALVVLEQRRSMNLVGNLLERSRRVAGGLAWSPQSGTGGKNGRLQCKPVRLLPIGNFVGTEVGTREDL